MSVCLIIGDYRQTLTAARALQTGRWRVVAGVPDPSDSHIRGCRYVHEVWQHPPVCDSPAWKDAFAEAVQRYRPDVVFPIGDLEIRWFAKNPDAAGLPVAAPDPAVVLECQDKTALMQRAAALNVPTPPWTVVGDMARLARAADELGYPCILKSNDPLQRLLGAKAIFCRDSRELARRMPEWPDGLGSVIVQRCGRGPRHNIYFAARQGDIVSVVDVRINRTDNVDGTGYAVEGVTTRATPQLLAHTAALAASLKYHGVGCAQYLLGGAEDISFLELNPRLGANFVIAHAAGVDLASMALQLALGRDIEPPPAYRHGLRYAWTVGDLRGLKSAVLSRTVGPLQAMRWLSKTAKAALSADVHVTWSVSDPCPTLMLLWTGFAHGIRNLVMGR